MRKLACWASLVGLAVGLPIAPAGAELFRFEQGELQMNRLPATEAPVDEVLLYRGQGQTALASYDNPGSGGGCADAGSCGGCGQCASCCGCEPIGGCWDNTLILFAGDGWKSRIDDDDNNNFGFRTGFNTGVGLGGSSVRGQIGATYGAYDFHGREQGPNDNKIESQIFLTGGVYKRSDILSGDAIAWGLVYDAMFDEHYGEHADNIKLQQIRGLFGYALSEANEVGVWAAFRANDDFAQEYGEAVDPMDQVNFFWHHNWAYRGDTWAYVGWADDPGEMVLGLNGQAPLSARVALFGGFHYILPSTSGGNENDRYAEETWNISFGLVFSPGNKAAAGTVSGRAGLPLLPVADNGSFASQTVEQ